MISLSIIIAAYNVESFIEKCILSCVSEKYQNQIEILVVDDGSTDSTLQKITGLENSIINLNVIQQKNQGLGTSRNIGIQSARGKYIWMIDGDDYMESDSLTLILENLIEDLDMYCVNYNVSDNTGKILYKAYPENFPSSILSGTDYYDLNYKRNYTWQYIFRKKIFTENNIRFKERINMQDSEILPKILLQVKTLKYLDVIGYNYVQYQNSFTNTQDGEKRYKYFKSIIAVRDSLVLFGESIRDQNPQLFSGIQNKLESLNQVILDHLVFYKYNAKNFMRNIELLRENGLFPLKAKVEGNKMNLVKLGINNAPKITNYVLNFFRK